MQSLYKLIAKIKRHYIKRPNGIWLPPPSDCVLMVYHHNRETGTQSADVFHDPFICEGQCGHGWKYGIVDHETNDIY